MKKYILVAILATSMMSVAYAQEARRQEKKIDRKEAKAAHKDEYGHEKKGDRKQERAMKTSEKISKKEKKGKYDN